MEIVILIALIMLNGIFSMSEMAMVSSRKFKLETAKKQGKSGAKTALDLSENPTKFLSTIQIGITLVGILLGIYSGDRLTSDLARFYAEFQLLKPIAQQLGTSTIVLVVTYLTIVMGELLPKRLAMTFPETIAMVLAKPMYILSLITSPFVWLLTFSNDLVLKLFGIQKNNDNKVTEEEIKSIVRESAQGGEIQNIEQDIVERVFELGDRKVNSLLTYRTDITFFDIEDSWEVIKEKINSDKHSAYPVVKNNNIDQIVGFALLKDLFEPILLGNFELDTIVKEPLYLNEKTSAYRVLELFKQEKLHYGIVVDEYGSTQGIVTMDDVMDALLGDATESNQDEYQIIQKNPTTWIVDGQYSIFDFCKYFNLQVDETIQNEYSTVAGLMIHLKEDLLDIDEYIDYENLRLKVIDKDGQRINKIEITQQ